MEDEKAQKIKLANSRKRFKELQELKKKKNAGLKVTETVNISTEQTPADSLTSSTHSSVTNDLVENALIDGHDPAQLPTYFTNSTRNLENDQQPVVFFNSFLQRDMNVGSPIAEKKNSSDKIFNYFSTSQSQTSYENMVSNLVDTPKPTENTVDHQFNEKYSLFPQENQHSYIAETQHIIHPNQDAVSSAVGEEDPEMQDNEIFESHSSETHTEQTKLSTKNRQALVDYLHGDNNENISETENQAIKDEIKDSSNMAQIQHSSVESLRQLSDQMAQLIGPEYTVSGSITDLEKRNLELASLLEEEKITSNKQKVLLNDLQSRIVELELEAKEREENSNLQMASELGRLKDELQCHVQTVGILVAEKTELSANLSQLELTARKKNAECEELQARLKTSRSRVADLEREVNILKAEKARNISIEQEQSELLVKLKQDYDNLRDQKEDLLQDLLEVREKLKNNSEDNLRLQKQNQELHSKLSLADIKIQQITSGEQHLVDNQVEKLTQEKFELEKQLTNYTLMLKTITKEREESSLQYQQYTEQLNTQLATLSARVEQLQHENENLSIQEQNRVKHMSELERQLQNLQNDQVAFAIGRTNVDVNLKNELEATREVCVQLQIEKTSAEENYTKATNEKEMLLKELEAKNDSLSQLESMVEQLRGNQPDSVKLLATMESDKVAAARAIQQNKDLKDQMESMQENFMKLENDRVVLTEKLNLEASSNKELLEKLQKTELQLLRLTDAIEIKDRELSHLRENSTEFNKQVLQHEQLADRLRHYEANENSSHILQSELQEAKQTIIKLTNEINMLKSDNRTENIVEYSDNIDVGVLRKQIEELELKNQELELKLQNHINDDVDHTGNDNLNESGNVLDTEAAMKRLEEKFKQTMQDIADLTEEKQRLEHLVLQLQGETETIGEYVALYQHQRMILNQKAVEKDQQLKQLANDREQIKTKLEKLNELIRKLIVEKGSVPKELLEQHEHLTSQSNEFCEEHSKIHNEINRINEDNKADANGAKNSETAEEIIALLSEIKTSNLVQPNANFHHCPWCSGQLITV